MAGTARRKTAPAAPTASAACAAGPCQGTANTVLDLLASLLSEKAQDNGGSLPIEKILGVIDTFKTGPGELADFYSHTFDSCHGPGSSLLGHAVDELLTERRAQTSPAIQARTEATLRHMAGDGLVVPRPVLTADGKPSNLERFRCDDATQDKIDALLAETGADPLVLAEIDLASLTLAADHLQRQPPGEQQLLILDLHLASLQNRRLAKRYLAACAALDDKVRASLVLALLGCDDGVPTAEVEAHLQQLRGLSRLRALALDREEGGENHLRRVKLHLLLLDYRQLAGAGRARGAVAALAKKTEKFGARLLIDNVPPETPAAPLAKAGASFFCYGKAIRPGG